MADNISKIYEKAKQKGVLAEGLTEEMFRQQTATEEGLKSFYDYATQNGMTFRAFDEFKNAFYKKPAEQPATAAEQHANAAEQQQQTQQPQQSSTQTQKPLTQEELKDIAFKMQAGDLVNDVFNKTNQVIADTNHPSKPDITGGNSLETNIGKANENARANAEFSFRMNRTLNETEKEAQEIAKKAGDELANMSFLERMAYQQSHDPGAELSKFDKMTPLQANSAAINSFIEDSRRLLKDVNSRNNFIGGVKSAAENVETWDNGLTSLNKNDQLLKAVKKFEKGQELTEDEALLLDVAANYMALSAYYSDKLGRWYKAGSVSMQSVPFMLQFMATPIEGAGNSLTKSLVNWGTKSFGKKVLYKAAQNALVKAPSMTALWGGKKIAAGAAERQIGIVLNEVDPNNGLIKFNGTIGGQILDDAVYNSMIDNYVENLSEMFFEPFAGLGGKTASIIAKSSSPAIKAVSSAMSKIGGSRAAQVFNKCYNNPFVKTIRDRAHFSGYLGEVAEEEVGGLLRLALNTDVNNLKEAGLDWDSQIDTFLGLAPTSILFGGLGLAGAGIQATSRELDIIKYRNGILNAQNSDEAREEAKKVIKYTLSRKDISRDTKADILRSTYYAYQQKVADDIQHEQYEERAAKEQEQEEIKNDIRMQAADDGNIYPVTLDGDTEYEYRIASGNFEIDENGKIVSDEPIIIKWQNETGEWRHGQVSADALTISGEIVRAEDAVEGASINAESEDILNAEEEEKSQTPNIADAYFEKDGEVTPATKVGDNYVLNGTEDELSLEDLEAMGFKPTTDVPELVELNKNKVVIQDANGTFIAERNADGTLTLLSDINGNAVEDNTPFAEETWIERGATITPYNEYQQAQQEDTTNVQPSVGDGNAMVMQSEGNSAAEQPAYQTDENGEPVWSSMPDAETFANVAIKQAGGNVAIARNFIMDVLVPQAASAKKQAMADAKKKPTSTSLSKYAAEMQAKEDAVNAADAYAKLLDDVLAYIDNIGKVPEETKTDAAENNLEEQKKKIERAKKESKYISLANKEAIEILKKREEEKKQELIEKAKNEGNRVGEKQAVYGIKQLSEALQNGDIKDIANAIQYIRNGITFGLELTESEKNVLDSGYDFLRENGVEISDLYLNPYKDGMKYIANFEYDESLPMGSRIIKSVIKPFLLKDGTLYQAAEITVIMGPDINFDEYDEIPDTPQYIEAEETKTEDANNGTRIEKEKKRDSTEVGVAGHTMRERFDNAVKFYGFDGTMTLENGTELTGRYVLIDAFGLTPSHDPIGNFVKKEGYPTTTDGQSINDRDYEHSKAEQAKVLGIAQVYDGRSLTSVPVVSNEGLVYGGNGRTMAGQIAAVNGTDTAYKEALVKNAQRFGFTADQIAYVPNARVVFMLDENLPYNTTSLAMFNENGMQSMNASELAQSITRKMNENGIGHISGMIEGHEDIEKFFQSNDAVTLVDYLISDGIISAADKNEMLDTRGLLSKTGQDVMSAIMLGTALQSDVIRLLENDIALRNNIIKALPVILKNKNFDEELRIIDEINNAIRAIFDMRNYGLSLNEFMRQLIIETDENGNIIQKTAADDYSTYELMLVEAMLSKKKTDFVNQIAEYNKMAEDVIGGQLNIFDEVTQKDDIINAILRINGKEQQDSADTGANSEEQREASRNVEEGSESSKDENSVGGNEEDTGRKRPLEEDTAKTAETETKTETAETKTESEKTKTESEKTKTESAESKTESAKTKTDDAVSKTESKTEEVVSKTEGEKSKTNEADVSNSETPAIETETPASDQKEEESNAESKDETQNKKVEVSENRIVDDNLYLKNVEILRKALNNLNIGINPEVMSAGAIVACYHIERGARTFVAYSKAMLKDLGEIVKPYLKSFYLSAMYMPEMQQYKNEMDSYEYVQAFDVESIKAEDEKQETAQQEATQPQEPQEETAQLKEEPNVEQDNQQENDNIQRGVSGSVSEPGRSDGSVTTDVLRGGSKKPRKESRRSDAGGEEAGDSSDRSGLTSVLSESEKKNTRNFRLERGQSNSPKTDAQRYAANMEAIRVLKQLQEEGKDVATKEQQDILSKFTGWGGLGAYFNFRGDNRQEAYALKELLTEEEYADAELSRNSAYYTPEYIIDTLWDIAKKLGFRGGNIAENSAGIGNILAHMPSDISERSNITATEPDAITSGILKYLYPDAVVHDTGYEKVNVVNGSVDLAITNVPFVSGMRVKDDVEKDLSKWEIHNFCIAKNIRKLADGGLGIFISTSATMDGAKELRRWIENEGNADVIGLFRLNSETFGGATVTSDIIVVRKRVNGEKSNLAIDVLDTEAVKEQMFEEEGKGGKVEEKKKVIFVNKYLAEHPENLGGEMDFAINNGDTRYGGTSVQCYPADGKNQTELLAQWVESISEQKSMPIVEHKVSKEYAEFAAAPEDVKEGGMFVDNKGNIFIKRDGRSAPFTYSATTLYGKPISEVVKDYLKIKDALNALIEKQKVTSTEEDIAKEKKALNDAYDNFVSKYGPINRPASRAKSIIRNDVDFSSIASLENYERHKNVDTDKFEENVTKTDIFRKRVIGTVPTIEVRDAKDGVIRSMNQFGELNIPKIAEWLRQDVETTKKQILEDNLGYENPANGLVEVSYKYLSGNVREKLKYAKEHNENGKYDKNIEALEKVLPQTIPFPFIHFQLGSTWIPISLYSDYVKEKFDVSASFVHSANQWITNQVSNFELRRTKNIMAGVTSQKLNKTVSGFEIFMNAINNRPTVVQVTEKDFNGTRTITDKEASQLAANKADEMKDDFVEWVKSRLANDEKLQNEIETTYNDRFNAIVPMEITQEFMREQLPGMNPNIKLRVHQQQAVSRALMEPVMLAHEVGSGKTFTLIAIAMEMRRLGTAKKPIIIVQNATLGQFAKSAQTLYPSAKILTPSEDDKTKAGRKQFFSKIMYNDWDMIIIPQSSLSMIPDSDERRRDFIREKIEEKEATLAAARDARLDNRQISSIGREIEKLNSELSEISSVKRDGKKDALVRHNQSIKAQEMLERETDDVVNFDELGIDAILLDEAHNYKHLGFETTMTRGVKGIDPSYSKRSASLYLKCQAVFDKSGHKNVVFATGTPISNTAAEVWTFMKYLYPKQFMKDNDIYYFDDFVHNFGRVSQFFEWATDGKPKEVTRFASYINIPELARMWLNCTHTILAKEIGEIKDDVPDIEGGGPTDIFIEQSPTLAVIMQAVRNELKRFEQMSGAQKRENSHIPLVMYGIAKRAAIEPKLVMPNAKEDDDSKLNHTIEHTLKALKDSEAYRGTCAIFCDNYKRNELRDGKKVVVYNMFDDMVSRLVARGVKREEIVVMKSGMSASTKEKIFEQVNNGDVRVIIGTTETLGTGVNIQQRLFFCAMMDIPDRPMDYLQRIGRIIRQGNLHKKWGIPVRILRFGVKKSLDVTGYQRLKTKSDFINSIMESKYLLNNNLSSRYIEEEEDQGAFDNPIAAISGCQSQVLLSKAERELRKLRAKKTDYENQQTVIINRLRTIDGMNREGDKAISELESSLEKIREYFPNKKAEKVSIDGTQINNEEELAAAFTEMRRKMNDAGNRIKNDFSAKEETLTFDLKFDDVTIKLNVYVGKTHFYKNGSMVTSASFKSIVESEPISLPTTVVPYNVADVYKYITDRVINGAENEEMIETAKKNIANREEEKKRLQEQQKVSFNNDDEIKAAEERVDALRKDVAAEMAEIESSYQDVESNIDINDLSIGEEDEESNEDADMFVSYAKQEPLSESEELAADAVVSALNSAGIQTTFVTEEEADDFLDEGYDGVQYRVVSDDKKDAIDPKSREDFESGNVTTTYQAKQMVEIDRKRYLLPPMAAVINGKYVDGIPVNEDGTIADVIEMADERPDLAIMVTASGTKVDENKGKITDVGGVLHYNYDDTKSEDWNNKHTRIKGEVIDGKFVPSYQFVLKKGTKSDRGNSLTDVVAAYDPYMHSLEVPITDQFKGAWERSNVVMVRVQVPNSEIDGSNTYHAEKAMLPTGVHSWKKGALGTQKNLYLSRYTKPIGIISDAEVAQAYVDEGITEVPFNIVKPSLRDALYERGITITPPTARSREDVVAAYNEWLSNHNNGRVQLMVQNNGSNRQVYGWTVNGKIYLVKERLDANTPIHEYTHIWLNAVYNKNYELYKRIAEIFSRENFPDIWATIDSTPEYKGLSEEGKLSEVVSRFSGKRGAEMMTQEAERIINEHPTISNRAKVRMLIGRAKRMLAALWSWVGENLFGIKSFGSAEEVADRVMYDLLNNTNLETGEIDTHFNKPTDENTDWQEELDLSTLSPLTIREKVLDSVVSAASQHNATAQTLSKAVDIVNSRIRAIRKAMSAQNMTDRDAIKKLTKMATIFLKNGWINANDRRALRSMIATIGRATEKTFDENARDLLTAVASAHLNHVKSRFNDARKLKAKKLNISGVAEVDKVDIQTRYMFEAFNDGINLTEDEIDDRINETYDKMDDAIAKDDSVTEMEMRNKVNGYIAAQRYVQTVGELLAEGVELKDALADAKNKSYSGVAHPILAKREAVSLAKEAVIDNMLDLAYAYQEITNELRLEGMAGAERATEFRRKLKDNMDKIRHFANSDMEGIDAGEYSDRSFRKWLANSIFAAGGLFSPMQALNSILKGLARKAPNGEGYLYDHFVRGFDDAAETEYQGTKALYGELDEKASDIMGKKMSWADMAEKLNKGKTLDLTVMDSKGNKKSVELTQGQLAYLYAVNKMTDGQMKLRAMGISSADMDAIEDSLTPDVKEAVDWLQDEFLPRTRVKYNKVHLDMFGTPMARIENYFPLRINKSAIKEEVDLANDKDGIGNLPGTVTGAIKERRRNAKPLDIMNADAFTVAVEHVREMEHWAAFCQLNRDANILLSYQTFKNRLANMSTIYGAGKQLYTNIKDAFKVAIGTYQPKKTKASAFSVNIAKGVSASKVSFRLFTAIKQLLSRPAFYTETLEGNGTFLPYFIKATVTPATTFKWAMQNLPLFEKRISKRTAGDTRLLEDELDWKIWHSKMYEWCSKIGMSPNAFIDALTCAQGAYAIYKSRKGGYINRGMSEEEADKRALQDASIKFNETQQSSEGAFVSTMQIDKDLASVVASLFQNSTIAYLKRGTEHIAQLYNSLIGVGKEQQVEYLRKKYVRLGFNESDAIDYANTDYKKSIARNAFGIFVFYYFINAFWRLGGNMVYLLFGDDDDKKKDLITDSLTGGAFAGPLRGTIIGPGLEAALDGYGWSEVIGADLPIESDIQKNEYLFNSEKYAEFSTNIINMLVAMGLGFNPETITNIGMSIIDACDGDLEYANDFMTLIFTIISVPESQIKELYIDELGTSAEEIQRTLKRKQYKLDDVAKEYARRRKMKASPIIPMSEEEEKKQEKSARSQIKRGAKERIKTNDQ